MKSMLKRICCLIISLAVCTGTVAIAAEVESQPQIGKKLSTAMYFLRELDIIGDYFDYNTDAGEKITRAEFADVVVRAMGINNVGRKDTYFYDVPLSHFACDQINTLAEMGFIHGVGDNCFEPDSYIHTGAACKIILAVLGYDKIASVSGGYLEGYIRTAAELELVNYVPSDSILTRGEMFLMIFEALQTPMYNINGFEGNSAIYEVDEEETFLKAYRQAFFGKGVVDGVKSSSFNEISLMENEVDIDGNVYTTRIAMDDMLGEEVEFIVYMDADWEDGEVVAAYTTGKTDVLNISEKQFVKFDKDNYKLFYADENDKRKSIKIERDVKLIYNGGFIESDISDRLNEGCDLKLLKDKDGYTRIVAKKKQNIVVKSVDVSAQVITNMADSTKSITLSKCRSVFLEKSGEAEMTLHKLAQGDVLSVYESYTESPDEVGEYVEIVVTTDRISGVVEEINQEDDKTWITVDGIEYFDLSGITFKARENVELYLDVDGDIAYAEVTPTNDFAAYLMSGKVLPDHDVYHEVLWLEMLKQDGEIVKLFCNEKLKVDGSRMEDAYEALESLSDADSGNFVPQLVLIKTDADGLVLNIDTTGGKKEEGTLRVSLAKGSHMYKGTGYLGNNNTDIVAINSNTITFRIPTEAMLKSGEATKDDYGVGASGYISDNDWITATTYKTTDKKTSVEEYMVVEMKGKASATPWPILVEKVISVYDEAEGEVLHNIIGYDGYTKVTTPVTETAKWTKKGAAWGSGSTSAIKPGMVVSFVTNSRGHAIEVDLVYDPANRTDYYKSGDYNAMMNEIGIAEDASTDLLVMRLGVEGRSIAIKPDAAEIMVYDEDKIIRKGTFMDAKLYNDSYNQSNPDTYSDVVVFQWQRWPRRVYIFK